MNDQLIPKQPRRLLQPSKQVLRDQLALAATEIERLRGEVAWLKRPWWKRVILPAPETRRRFNLPANTPGHNPPPTGPKPAPPPNPPRPNSPPAPPPTLTIREGVNGPTPTVPKP